MAYEVTTFDVCMPGFERLRNRDEFILVAFYVTPDMTREDLTGSFVEDIQSCERPDGFDYDAVRATVREFMAGVDMAKALTYVEELTEDDDSEGCRAYLYIRDTSEADDSDC